MVHVHGYVPFKTIFHTGPIPYSIYSLPFPFWKYQNTIQYGNLLTLPYPIRRFNNQIFSYSASNKMKNQTSFGDSGGNSPAAKLSTSQLSAPQQSSSSWADELTRWRRPWWSAWRSVLISTIPWGRGSFRTWSSAPVRNRGWRPDGRIPALAGPGSGHFARDGAIVSR